MNIILTAEKEIELLDKFIQFLKTNRNRKINDSNLNKLFVSQKNKTKIEDLSMLCGCLSDEDAKIMTKVIEEECERIDYEEW